MPKKETVRFLAEPTAFVTMLHPVTKYRLYFETNDFLKFPPYPNLAYRLREIHERLPELEELFDFELLIQTYEARFERWKATDKSRRKRVIFPEFERIHDIARKQILTADWPKQQKAHFMLAASTQDIERTESYEACVYLASRGEGKYCNVSQVIDLWRRWVAELVLHPHYPVLEKIPKALRNRILSGSLTVAESASILDLPNGPTQRFWHCPDYEGENADVTMVRMVEWYGIGGFNPWWESITNEIRESMAYGIDSASRLAAWLFLLCRSDLLIRLVGKDCLETYLLMLYNSSTDKTKPWCIYRYSKKDPGEHDSIFMAALLSFVWERVNPGRLSRDVQENAVEFIMNSQSASGGWCDWLDGVKPSIDTTAIAIHALALAKPTGWIPVVGKAATWLESQQDDFGFWYCDGYSHVGLTVLVMDAISLAAQKETVTFQLRRSYNNDTNTADRQRIPGQTRPRRFDVALSFPGEKRAYVKEVADRLTAQLGQGKIFYDQYFKAELARINLDSYLQRIYHDESDLIVVFLCEEYERKKWCGIEWRAIRNLIETICSDRIMPLRFDDTEINGLFDTDGYVDISDLAPDTVADLICQRVELNRVEKITGTKE